MSTSPFYLAEVNKVEALIILGCKIMHPIKAAVQVGPML